MEQLPKIVSESLNQAYREIQVRGKKKKTFSCLETGVSYSRWSVCNWYGDK